MMISVDPDEWYFLGCTVQRKFFTGQNLRPAHPSYFCIAELFSGMSMYSCAYLRHYGTLQVFSYNVMIVQCKLLILLTFDPPQGTSTRMNNVFNDFLMLANIQFVENVSICLFMLNDNKY